MVCRKEELHCRRENQGRADPKEGRGGDGGSSEGAPSEGEKRDSNLKQGGRKRQGRRLSKKVII